MHPVDPEAAAEIDRVETVLKQDAGDVLPALRFVRTGVS